MLWFVLLIPVVASIILYKFFQHKIVWWELAIPAGSSLVCLLILKAIAQYTQISDVEYWGSTVTHARYYEPYETYVHQTCTREVECGTDSEGKTVYCTESYDCSYCDRNGSAYIVYDNQGNTWQVNKDYFDRLTKQWRTSPRFVELNRDITYHFGCGEDGDMYEVKWDGRIESSEAAVTIHDYENKVQASHSTFKFPEISKAQAAEKHLYHYPELYSYYRQQAVLGLDLLKYQKADSIQKLFEFYNGYNGPTSKVKLFILLFKNKSLSVAMDQQAYWSGGNKNELVICIGVDDSLGIDWVYPFSWTDNKRCLVECREEIAELKKLDFGKIHTVVDKAIKEYFHYKDFEDFDYLSVDLPAWAGWIAVIQTIIVTVLTSLAVYHNDINNESGESGYFRYLKRPKHNY